MVSTGVFDMTGFVALVTGASSGLGRRFVEVLAGAGASVALAARRKDKLEQVAAEIGKSGSRTIAVPMDVGDIASIPRAFDAAEAALGTVTVLVNNAGIAATGPALETGEADWDRVLDVNLKGAFFAATEAARRLVRAGKPGAIVNIASIAGIRATGGISAYAAAKAGLEHLTRTLALEWARHDIRVNALAPGYFATELNRDFLASEAGEAMRKRIPMRRFGEPADLDGALLLLASDAGRFMTGTTVVVDGGHLASSL
jgi:NAD(P)-dependent dehydrogenase (short-subunit alcohol dehydrogenase family)